MKVHLRETNKKPEDWRQSPHIFDALSAGIYAACEAGIVDNEHVTEDPAKITCSTCRLIAEKVRVLTELQRTLKSADNAQAALARGDATNGLYYVNGVQDRLKRLIETQL